MPPESFQPDTAQGPSSTVLGFLGNLGSQYLGYKTAVDTAKASRPINPQALPGAVAPPNPTANSSGMNPALLWGGVAVGVLVLVLVLRRK